MVEALSHRRARLWHV